MQRDVKDVTCTSFMLQDSPPIYPRHKNPKIFFDFYVEMASKVGGLKDKTMPF